MKKHTFKFDYRLPEIFINFLRKTFSKQFAIDLFIYQDGEESTYIAIASHSESEFGDAIFVFGVHAAIALGAANQVAAGEEEAKENHVCEANQLITEASHMFELYTEEGQKAFA